MLGVKNLLAALMGFAKEPRQDRCQSEIPLDLQRFTRY